MSLREVAAIARCSAALALALACTATMGCGSRESTPAGAEFARLGTRHAVSFIMPMPKSYADEIRRIPGVRRATWAQWFGGKNPTAQDSFFSSMAVDAHSYFDVYADVEIEPEAVARWRANRRGAVVEQDLAAKFGWKVGDRIHLTGTIFPGDWKFDIAAIYKAPDSSLASTFLFHWDYLNDSAAPDHKDEIGWVISVVDDAAGARAIGARIDQTFDAKSPRTVTIAADKCAPAQAGGRGRPVCVGFPP
jgi:putative ABC transport system permease protein